ncbi:MAG TPA: hypothetical protein VGM83_18880 [Devosiaceae bacterium]
MRISIIAAALLGSMITTSQAASFQSCTAPGRTDLILEQDADVFDGKTITCLEGGDFIFDMTACAPRDGYGVSAPTGDAALVEVTNDFKKTKGGLGTVMFYGLTPSAYEFTAGNWDLDDKYSQDWTFTLDRKTHKGALSVLDNPLNPDDIAKSPIAFRCMPVTRKF